MWLLRCAALSWVCALSGGPAPVQALAYLHPTVLHRDLKASNLDLSLCVLRMDGALFCVAHLEHVCLVLWTAAPKHPP